MGSKEITNLLYIESYAFIAFTSLEGKKEVNEKRSSFHSVQVTSIFK